MSDEPRSGRAEPGQLEGVFAAITIGVHQGVLFRERMRADTHTGEWDQQEQVPISGAAGKTPGFVDDPVPFQMPFLYAPAQRLVPFRRPHFTKGFELLNAGATIVRLDAYVINWVENESGWTVGATVRFVVDAPMADTPVLYSAKAHLVFSGYSSFAEGGEFNP